MRVLIVDDHPIARKGLSTLVNEAFRVERVLEATTAEEALVAAQRERPELILLDLNLPGVPQTSVLCRQLQVAAPRTRIAIITAFDEPEAVRRCFEAGAHACLLKDTTMIDLRGALRAVLAGERVIDPRIARRLAGDEARLLRGDPSGVELTDREREVLQLLAEGCSNRLIAEQLFIAETTVKGYVSSLLEKLEATSRLQAVVRATEHGLL
jgi:DNA-binding NarL/FixJ family response regulator